MRHTFILNTACALTAAVCLGLAYILAGYWLIIPVLVAMTLFWRLFKRWAIFRTSSALLSIFVVLAAVGVTLNVSTPLILIAITAALTSWDLVNFVQSAADNQRGETSLPLERFHLRALAIASAGGLLLSLITSYINFKLPFGITLVLVLIAIACIAYGLQPLVKRL